MGHLLPCSPHTWYRPRPRPAWSDRWYPRSTRVCGKHSTGGGHSHTFTHSGATTRPAPYYPESAWARLAPAALQEGLPEVALVFPEPWGPVGRRAQACCSEQPQLPFPSRPSPHPEKPIRSLGVSVTCLWPPRPHSIGFTPYSPALGSDGLTQCPSVGKCPHAQPEATARRVCRQ